MPRAPATRKRRASISRPAASLLTQAMVRELAAGPGVLLLAGRFEGIDERVIAARGLREISIGDYVLAGGELAAMVLIDAVVRLLPGVVGAGGLAARGELRGGPAGVSPVYAPARVGGRGNPRGAALRRSQAHRRVAARGGGADHPRAPAGPLARARPARTNRSPCAGARRRATLADRRWHRIRDTRSIHFLFMSLTGS